MTYFDSLEINKKYLDTKDLKPYLSTDKSVNQIWDEIENAFWYDDDNMPKELDGFPLNCMDELDLAYYLAERYDMKINEAITYYLTPKNT